MEVKHYNKKDFTIEDFLEQTKACNENAGIFNSNYYPNYVAKNIYSGFHDSIRGFYNEGHDVIVDYDWNKNIVKTKTLKDFREFIEKESVDLKVCLNRDVEDGYVYANYDDMVFNENIIVLC